MNIKIPWLVTLLGVLALILGLVAFGWWLRGQRAEELLAEHKEAAAADSVAFESRIAAVVDLYDDSLEAARAVVETMTVRIPVAVTATRETAASLVSYLNANDDTLGLRLFREDEAADSTLLAWTTENYDARLVVKDLEIAKRDTLILEYDDELTNVRQRLADALREAEVAMAETPWALRAGGDILKAAAVGTVAGLMADDVATGVVTGGVAFGLQQIGEIKISLPF